LKREDECPKGARIVFAVFPGAVQGNQKKKVGNIQKDKVLTNKNLKGGEGLGSKGQGGEVGGKMGTEEGGH